MSRLADRAGEDQKRDERCARAEHCEEEYKQVRHAFVKTILPHVDTNMMKLVRSITWLNAEDLK